MVKKFAEWVVRFRTVIIIGTIIITVIFAYFAKNVKISSTLIDLAPEDNRELLDLKKNMEKFGSSTFVMVTVRSDDPYSFSTLTKIKSISDEIKKLPEVEEVIDPINAAIFKYMFGILVVKQSFPGGKIPESREGIEQVKREMLSEPIMKNVIVSENGESLAIYIRLKDNYDTQHLRNKLLSITNLYRGPEEFYFSGLPIIENYVHEYLRRDSIRLALPIVLLVIIVLFINFRSLRGIILPLSIMFVSIVWTLGLMEIFGKSITIVGVILPVLILINSSSYSIHFLNQYYKDIKSDYPIKRNVERSIRSIGNTIFLAAVTTIAGFAALTINRIKPMMELGIFVLIGIFFSMLLSLTFLPGILAILKKPKIRFYTTSRGRMNLLFGHLGDLIINRWKIILIFACAIGIWSIIGLKEIHVDASWRRFFKKDSEISISEDYIKSNFGGASTMNVSFEAENESDIHFRSLDSLRYVEKVEQWIRDKNIFGPTTSIVDYIKRANQLLHENNPDYYRLPDSDAELLKILLMFKLSEFNKSLGNVITVNYKNTNILIKAAPIGRPDPTIKEFKNFLKEFKAYIKNQSYEGVTVGISGVELVFLSLVDYLIRSQFMSIAISIVIVFLIIAYKFRSYAYGFFGLVPIMFGLLLNFGVMSYFDISIDFVTAMISSIAVGMGVDNSIHYLIRFSETKHSLPLHVRIKEALVNSGIPIFFTALTLIAGFSALLISNFKPILYFGLLISVTMLGCLIGIIFILPAFIYFIKPVSIIRGRIR